MILEWICIGFGIWKGSLFIPHVKEKASNYGSMEYLRWLLRSILSFLRDRTFYLHMGA